MNITKLGHCCLLIEDKGKVIMTDPGAWSTTQNEVKGVDLILITHEHADHFHLESLKKVLINNPQAKIVTNSRVGELLQEESIPFAILEHGQKQLLSEIELAGFGTEHANIYPTIPNVMNTGYLIQNRLFYPGDALTNPEVPVEIVAMPIIGPWMKMSEALDWVRNLEPEVCIPVHDGMLQPRKWIYKLPTIIFNEAGIKFDIPEIGKQLIY